MKWWIPTLVFMWESQMPNPINVTLFFLIHHSVYSHRCHPPKWTGPWLLLKIIFLMPGTGLYLSEIQNARSVQLLSHVRLFVTSWTAAHQASLSITNSRSLLKLMSIELVMPFNYLILCHPLFLLPSIFFNNESALHIRWPKYWHFRFSISPSSEYSGLTSFRIDWFDFLAVKSLLQHHSSKASILRRSAFFIVQLPHPYMTTWKKNAR